MPENVGIAPPDFSTPVGQVRAAVGDVKYEVIAPIPPDTEPTGLGEYQLFGDDEIEAFLAISDDSIWGAAAAGLTQLAISAAREAKSVKDFDLQVDLTKRATELRLLAKQAQDKADAEGSEVFELFPVIDQFHCDDAELEAKSIYYARYCSKW